MESKHRSVSPSDASSGSPPQNNETHSPSTYYSPGEHEPAEAPISPSAGEYYSPQDRYPPENEEGEQYGRYPSEHHHSDHHHSDHHSSDHHHHHHHSDHHRYPPRVHYDSHRDSRYSRSHPSDSRSSEYSAELKAGMGTIFVGNLPTGTKKEDVLKIFSDIGFSPEHYEPKPNFAFLTFKDEEIEPIVEALQGQAVIGDQLLKIERSHGQKKSRGDKSSAEVNRSLFCVNFPPETTQGDLHNFFAPIGPLVRVQVVKRFAFVEFTKLEDAIEAVKQLNGKLFLGFPITVEFSGKKDKRSKPRRLPPPGWAGHPHHPHHLPPPHHPYPYPPRHMPRGPYYDPYPVPHRYREPSRYYPPTSPLSPDYPPPDMVIDHRPPAEISPGTPSYYPDHPGAHMPAYPPSSRYPMHGLPPPRGMTSGVPRSRYDRNYHHSSR